MIFSFETLSYLSPASFEHAEGEEGNFFLTNLKDKPYYLFALKDMNNNMMFDLPNESIAFIDSAFRPDFREVVYSDTIRTLDSLALLVKDTVFVDTVITYSEMITTLEDVQLFMFTEDFQKQYFTNKLRPEKEIVVFAFNRELKDSISVIPLSEKNNNEEWFIITKSCRLQKVLTIYYR